MPSRYSFIDDFFLRTLFHNFINSNLLQSNGDTPFLKKKNNLNTPSSPNPSFNTLDHRPSVFLHIHKDAQRWAAAQWGCPAHPAGLIRGQPGPRSFPGCRVEVQTTPPLSTLLLHRVVCPHCFHTDGEKNGHLEKCRRRRGIQMQPAPRSFYLDQYCPASSGSAHKAEGLLHSTVIHLGCCGVWQVNTFFFSIPRPGKKGFLLSDEKQQALVASACKSLLPSSGNFW